MTKAATVFRVEASKDGTGCQKSGLEIDKTVELEEISSFFLIALVGFLDYVAGYVVGFSLFYLLPVFLLAWFIGPWIGNEGNMKKQVAGDPFNRRLHMLGCEARDRRNTQRSGQADV